MEEAALAFREYQLAMLAPMCESAPAQPQAVLDAVDASRADAEVAADRRRWAIPTTLDEYKTACGVPDWEAADEPQEGRQMRYARWDLAFWPGLQIELTQVWPTTVIFRRFVRRREVPSPRLESLEDLAPWSCTVGEFDRSVFGPLENVDGFGAVGDVYAFVASDPDSGKGSPTGRTSIGACCSRSHRRPMITCRSHAASFMGRFPEGTAEFGGSDVVEDRSGDIRPRRNPCPGSADR
ncbi:hypothetical protein FB390_3745 [Nocardia bhagyanarayanae]|uniref:Uncharacterized protein n=1 Tax=Nocardia bhagyanarayanae TaxID=1215925 RepID=A0A543FDV6_9NOCA|nr:hypothetical protein FB390_3745 [Nocardia bhagyanarayanae]